MPIRQRSHVLWRVALSCDAAVLIGSLFAAIWIRSLSPIVNSYGPLYPIGNYLWMLWVIVPTWLWLIKRMGLHRAASLDSVSHVLTKLGRVQVLGALILLATVYLVDRLEVSRLLTQIFLAVSACLLVSEKLALRSLVRWARKHGRWSTKWRVLVVNGNVDPGHYLNLLHDHPNWAVEIIGPVPLEAHSPRVVVNGPAQALEPQWRTIMRETVIDEVVAVTPWQDAPETQTLAESCVERGVTFRIMVTMPPAEVGHYYVESLGDGAYLLSLETVPQGTVSLFAKRVIDIVGALAGLTLCAIAYIWYGLRIKRESAGSVLFSQARVGQNGRIFTLYKFRTMCADAETKLSALHTQNEMRGYMFKMKNDPRVTRLGRVLRRRHIDELPQFWNVLRGEMSLVGTRPPTPAEVARYSPRHYRRLSMKPGITGLWQLNGNGSINDFEDVVRYDCRYIDNWSLWLDCRILARTAAKVLRGDGW